MALRKYRLLVGTHRDLSELDSRGNVVMREHTANTSSDIVESHHDLAAKFGKEKFRDEGSVVAVAPAPAPTGTGAGEGGENKGNSPAGEGKVESALGEDVTGEFPDAILADYKVFRKGKKHYVAEPQKLDVALNKAGLAAADVAEFITDLAK